MKSLQQQNENILKGKKQVLIKGIDGYAVSFSVEEIKEKDNVYLGYFLNKLQKNGLALILVSHDLSFVQSYCGRILCFYSLNRGIEK